MKRVLLLMIFAFGTLVSRAQFPSGPYVGTFSITDQRTLNVPPAGLNNITFAVSAYKPSSWTQPVVLVIRVQPIDLSTISKAPYVSSTITWTSNPGSPSSYLDNTHKFNLTQADLNNRPAYVWASLESPNGETIYDESIDRYAVNVTSTNPPPPTGFIQNNTISYNGPSSYDAIGDPPAIIGATASFTSGVNPDATFRYRWQYSVQNATSGFQYITPADSSKDYNPQNLIQTTYFRRVIEIDFGGYIQHNSSNVITITINNAIIGNVINTTGPKFFDGSADPGLIRGTQPLVGNSGTITAPTCTYQWQSALLGDPDNFANISGAILMDYNPPPITETKRYRRIAYYGSLTSMSNVIDITKLSGNYIQFPGASQKFYHSRPQTPPAITGTVITGTDKSIEYFWAESSTGELWHAVWGNDASHIPDETIATTYYRRDAILKDDDDNIVFTANSNVVVAFITDPIEDNTICCDQTVYGASTPLIITGSTPSGGFPPYGYGSYSYSWYTSVDNINWTYASSGTYLNGGKDYQPPVGLIGIYYYKRVVADFSYSEDHYKVESNSVQVNYQNTVPIGASITNPILTDATFSIDCLEVLRSQDSNAPGFSNQRGGPGKDVYFKVYGDANLGVRSCQSSVPTKQYLYDENFNLLTPNSTYPGTSYADCFFGHYMGFTNGVYTGKRTYYIMVEGVGSDGTMNVQFGTYTYSDCPDTYMGFYWLEPGYGQGGEGERMASASVVYPSPAESQSTIKLGKSLSKQPTKVFVYNKYNALVKSFVTDKEEITFSVEDLPKDIYYIKIEGEKKSETHRLIVK